MLLSQVAGVYYISPTPEVLSLTMVRTLRVAAAQVGRIDRGTSKDEVVARLIKLLEEAASKQVKLAVFPETTFSEQIPSFHRARSSNRDFPGTFFPRYYFEDLNSEELASYFEQEPDNDDGITAVAATKPFFDRAAELGIDIAIGYGEQTPEGKRYNTASYVSGTSKKVIGKYRKIHLPGTFEPFDAKDTKVTNQLEKRYFLPGNLGFKAFRAPSLKKATNSDKSPIIGMLICNDRRWAEGWRAYGLQGVEIMCIGYVSRTTVSHRNATLADELARRTPLLGHLNSGESIQNQ